MARDKVIDRVRKLLALAGNNPNENEAEAAAKAADKLMREHVLSQADLAERGVCEAIGTADLATGLGAWKIELGWAVAKHCQVSALLFKNGARSVLRGWGYEADLELWKYLYDVCYRHIEGEARAYRDDGARQAWDRVSKADMNAFRRGAAYGVASKLREIREASDEAHAGDGSTALVHQRGQAAREAMREANPRIGAGWDTSVGSNAQGFRAGQRVRLSPGLGSRRPAGTVKG